MKRYPWFANEFADVDDMGLNIRWQRGPLDVDVNGASPDMVIRALIRKFELWQGEWPCEENANILSYLEVCLGELDKRTRDRARRGVMGRNEV